MLHRFLLLQKEACRTSKATETASSWTLPRRMRRIPEPRSEHSRPPATGRYSARFHSKRGIIPVASRLAPPAVAHLVECGGGGLRSALRQMRLGDFSPAPPWRTRIWALSCACSCWVVQSDVMLYVSPESEEKVVQEHCRTTSAASHS